MEEQITPEEQAMLQEYYNHNYPQMEEKTSPFQFFNKIMNTKDTSKVGNLDATELFGVRGLKNAGLFANLLGMKDVAHYMNQKAETILATSNSKIGFLIQAAITQKKSSTSKIKTGSEEKSKWFKDKTQQQQEI